MAGGKETPRQKMINLMYLVLLALLALQVSSAIIQKFHYLNASMEKANDLAFSRNGKIIQRIHAAVEEGKNNPKDVKVYEAALAIQKATNELRNYLHHIKSGLVETTGGKDDDGNFVGAKEEEKVAVAMLGPGDSKSGQGYELKEKLDHYVKQVQKILSEHDFNTQLSGLAMDGGEDPVFKNDPDQKNKDFAHLNFESTPLVAALAVLSEKETTVNSLESQALTHLLGKVHGNIIPIDKVRPVVMSQTSRVVAGLEYEADMFMGAYASTFKPKMTFEGQELDVNAQGSGKIKFKARGGNYTDGLSKRKWKGTITYPKAGGGDSVYTVEHEYYVVEPVIQVQSVAVNSLYKNCGNEMTINVPALGSNYDPRFTATGARIINTGQKGRVKIVPSQPNVSISVSNNGVHLGKLDYKVWLVPKPAVYLTIGNSGRPNVVDGETLGRLARLKIHIDPDIGFAKSNPDDAQYRATKWKVQLVRNRRLVQGAMNTGDGARINLGRVRQEARSGDNIIVEILEIKRKTFDNRTELVNMPASAMTYVLPVQ